MTESQIQNLLHGHLAAKRHQLIVPNVGCFGWEADLVSVTQAGYAHEYEVKVSRSDYERDFDATHAKWLKHEAFRGYGRQKRMPAYFWYAVAEGLVEESEVPDYAGLIVCTDKIQVVKKAPRLHSQKLCERNRDYLTRGLMVRYWQERKQNA